MTTLKEISSLLPRYIDKESLFKLELLYAFEPNGRASETWEDVWVLILPNVPGYWFSLSGWQRGAWGDGMTFKSPSLEEVLAHAKDFLLWYRECA
jgi:hypothetical protein